MTLHGMALMYVCNNVMKVKALFQNDPFQWFILTFKLFCVFKGSIFFICMPLYASFTKHY